MTELRSVSKSPKIGTPLARKEAFVFFFISFHGRRRGTGLFAKKGRKGANEAAEGGEEVEESNPPHPPQTPIEPLYKAD